MKTKIFKVSKLIALISLLLVASMLFSACGTDGDLFGSPKGDNTETEAPVITPETTFEFISNGDGTCAVTTDLSFEADLDARVHIDFPAAAPNGETVVAIKNGDTAINEIPRILLPEHFQKIDNDLKQAMESGLISNFFYNKFKAFFNKIDLSKAKNDTEKAELLKKHPVVAITPVYIFAIDASWEEIVWVTVYLNTFTDYTPKDIIADYETLVNQVTADDKCTDEISEYLASLAPQVHAPIVSVSIPDSIKTIGENAFWGWDTLKSVEIPSSVTAIENFAFSYCGNLKEITFSEGLLTIGDSAFTECLKLYEIVLPDSLKTLGDSAFNVCAALITVTLGKNLTNVNGAFLSCDRLTVIANKSSLDLSKISQFKSVLQIYNPETEASKLEITEDQFVFFQSETDCYLIDYRGDATELTLPESFENQSYLIYRKAFCNNETLKTIFIPQKVSMIDRQAFSGCSSLSEVTIEYGCNKIEEFAFSGCTKLTDIYYKGSKYEWLEEVEKADGWDSGTGNYVVHCTDRDIPKADS